MATFVPPAALALFADDFFFTSMCLADLAGVEPHLWAAQEGLGLEVNWEKTRVIPLGPRTTTWQESFQTIFPDDHPFRSMQIVDDARLLGYKVGRGDQLELTGFALEKMQSRIQKVVKLEAGMAMNRVLLAYVIYGCSAHVLRSVAPTAHFERYWEKLQDIVHVAPRKWFTPYQEHAKQLFGIPGRVVGLRQYRDRLLAKILQQLHGMFWEHAQRIDDWLAEPESLLLHPLNGWLQQGCLHTWKSTGEFTWRGWGEVLRRIRRPTTERAVVQTLLRERLLENCSGLPLPWREQIKKGFVERCCKNIAATTPSAAIALLRLFLNGLPTLNRKVHEGDCPWCRKWHLRPGWVPRLWQGCFKRVLHNLPSFSLFVGDGSESILHSSLATSAAR